MKCSAYYAMGRLLALQPTNVTNASDDQQIIQGNYSSINEKAAKAEMDDTDGQKDGSPGWMGEYFALGG